MITSEGYAFTLGIIVGIICAGAIGLFWFDMWHFKQETIRRDQRWKDLLANARKQAFWYHFKQDRKY